MDLQTLLNQKQITKCHLSKISGVPKTTIMDICAGRSKIERCSAKTISLQKPWIAQWKISWNYPLSIDGKTGPKDEAYFE